MTQTTTFHGRLTQDERDVCQEWLMRRYLQLKLPTGIRRRMDKLANIKLPLRAWRERFGLSITELLRRIGNGRVRISIDTIRAIENGTAAPHHLQHMGQIAAALGIDVKSIVMERAKATKKP